MTVRVLVVEDDRDIAQAIRLNLQLDGCLVHIVHDGLAALPAAREFQPDCMILDVVMPGTDGIEVCRNLRADEQLQGIPVLMLSAKSLADDKLAGLDAGADDYLVKPFEPAELVDRVLALVQQREAGSDGA